MATRRVWSGATGANDGSSWANAYTTFAAAVTASTASGDVILVHKTHTESLTVATTYTVASNVLVVCVDKDNGDALATMDGTTGLIGSSAALNFDGAFNVRMVGMVFKSSYSSGGYPIAVARSDGAHFELESCLLWLSATSSSGYFSFGYDASARNSYVKLKNCELRNASSSFKIGIYCRFEMEGGSCNFVAGTTLINAISNVSATPIFSGVDLSSAAMTLLGDQTSIARSAIFRNCKLNASTTPLATQTLTNNSAGEVWLYDCAAGDVHINMAHYNPLGSTVVSTSVYANDGWTYDGTNRCSWVVSSTANASYIAPYVSPWMTMYNGTMSAITPSLEVMRDGSATAYTDAEVWAEWSYKGNSGSPMTKYASDRMVPNGTPAAQATSAKSGADWTGESATAWFGKLDSGAAITPAEIGYLQARICIGAPSATVYVDPQIRG